MEHMGLRHAVRPAAAVVTDVLPPFNKLLTPPLLLLLLLFNPFAMTVLARGCLQCALHKSALPQLLFLLQHPC
jgi:hypothetical protein